MIFSVWNAPARAYDYYESRGTPVSLSGPPTPAHLRKRPALGISPGAAGWPLPSDARMVGRGPYARGAVASEGRGSLGDLEPTSFGTLLVALAVGVAAWFVWHGSARSR